MMDMTILYRRITDAELSVHDAELDIVAASEQLADVRRDTSLTAQARIDAFQDFCSARSYRDNAVQELDLARGRVERARQSMEGK